MFPSIHPHCLFPDELLTYGCPSVVRVPGWSSEFWANYSSVFPIETDITIHYYYYYYYYTIWMSLVTGLFFPVLLLNQR